jgi:hypothetical protein
MDHIEELRMPLDGGREPSTHVCDSTFKRIMTTARLIGCTVNLLASSKK